MRKFFLGFAVCAAAAADPLLEEVEHHEADSNGVKIHYVTLGEGPLVLMIHGFPDYWYSWRHQMPTLAEHYTVAAMDQRAYNKSDAPEGQENYNVQLLAADAAAVIKDAGYDKAIVVGHDWGGFVAWTFAATKPEMVERLVVCNLPHPHGMARELATNPEQQKNAGYARAFQQPGAHNAISLDFLATMPSGGDPEILKPYKEAFDRSNLECMLHYYKENYPEEPYHEIEAELPDVQAPVLIFHGLKDTALHAAGLNDTWEWVDAPVTIATVPNAEHWVHHDAPEYVTQTMLDWLKRQPPK